MNEILWVLERYFRYSLPFRADNCCIRIISEYEKLFSANCVAAKKKRWLFASGPETYIQLKNEFFCWCPIMYGGTVYGKMCACLVRYFLIKVFVHWRIVKNNCVLWVFYVLRVTRYKKRRKFHRLHSITELEPCFQLWCKDIAVCHQRLKLIFFFSSLEGKISGRICLFQRKIFFSHFPHSYMKTP